MQQTISKTNHCILWVVGASYCGGGNLELTRKTREGLQIEPLYFSSIQCVMKIPGEEHFK